MYIEQFEICVASGY